MRCRICADGKKIRLPMQRLEASPIEDDPTVIPDGDWKEFDCPQCVPKVPYNRVRALKVVTAYKAGDFARLQMPIERQLAARFGEYLLREGLIRFSQRGSEDMGQMEQKITVTAHLGVVAHENVKRAGAIPEIATTAATAPPRELSERAKRKIRVNYQKALEWSPPDFDDKPSEPVTDEFDEPMSALGQRFAGLEIE